MDPTGKYKTSDAVPEAPREGVPAGTALLVRADGTDVRDVVLGLLSTDRPDEGAVFITRDDPHAGLAACESYAGERWCISCGDADESDEWAVSVPSPDSITDIGVAFSQVIDRAAERSVGRVRVGVDLLDPLLKRGSPSNAFRFLHVFSGYVRNRGQFAAVAFDPDAHDRATVRNVESLFDFELVVRRTESGRRSARFRALSSGQVGPEYG